VKEQKTHLTNRNAAANHCGLGQSELVDWTKDKTMEIEIAVICDAATVQGDKMNILGAFGTVRAAVEPIIMPPFSIALRIRFMKLEEGDKALRIGFVDADGQPVFP